MSKKTTELLFSYGTLQNREVQLKTFGRELSGTNDELLAHRLLMVEINNCDVVELSGENRHPIAISDTEGETVKGVVFAITPQELAKSDEYEVDDYHRILGQLKSGKQAWVYVGEA